MNTAGSKMNFHRVNQSSALCFNEEIYFHQKMLKILIIKSRRSTHLILQSIWTPSQKMLESLPASKNHNTYKFHNRQHTSLLGD